MSPLPRPLGRSILPVTAALLAVVAGGCSFDTEEPTSTASTSTASTSTATTSSSPTSASTGSVATSSSPGASPTSPPTSTTAPTTSTASSPVTSSPTSSSTPPPPPTSKRPDDAFTAWAEQKHPGASWIAHVTSVDNHAGVLSIKTDLPAGSSAQAKPIVDAGAEYAASGAASGLDGNVVVLSATGSTLGFRGMD